MDLVARLAEADPRALQEVISAHDGAVHRIVRTILADAGVAEEVAQDVFLELWKRPERYDESRGSLRSYLVAMARNKAIDRIRTHYARQRVTEAVLKESQTSATHVDSSEETVEQRDLIFGAIRKLPAAQREALVLAYYGGRTYREVALELEVAEGTIKTRLRQALISLRHTLSPEVQVGSS